LYVGGSGPGNYSRIQDAIDNASDGDTVFVYSGIYYEHVNVNKPILLQGENREITVIDGGGEEDVVYVSKNASIRGFTIRNSGNASEAGNYDFGIEVHAGFVDICDNIVSNNNGLGGYI
jgi:nitrous oxidase accessory protein NosD